MATDTAGEETEVATDTAAAIIEGTAPLRSEPGEVVDAATPMRSEPEEVIDAATGSRGTKPIREPEAVADC